MCRTLCKIMTLSDVGRMPRPRICVYTSLPMGHATGHNIAARAGPQRFHLDPCRSLVCDCAVRQYSDSMCDCAVRWRLGHVTVNWKHIATCWRGFLRESCRWSVTAMTCTMHVRTCLVESFMTLSCNVGLMITPNLSSALTPATQTPSLSTYVTFVIALHLSYLEWLKYKTAKPLLYTVCRTRNQKELGKKWSGKEISFKAVPENSQRWSWGDVGRQTVPEATSSHWKCTIFNQKFKRSWKQL